MRTLLRALGVCVVAACVHLPCMGRSAGRGNHPQPASRQHRTRGQAPRDPPAQAAPAGPPCCEQAVHPHDGAGGQAVPAAAPPPGHRARQPAHLEPGGPGRGAATPAKKPTPRPAVTKPTPPLPPRRSWGIGVPGFPGSRRTPCPPWSTPRTRRTSSSSTCS